MNLHLIHIIYLVSSVSFIAGLKMLSHPLTARKGNLLAAAGMVLAIFATIFIHDKEVPLPIYGLIFGAIAIGTVVGWLVAVKVQMTKMPELVSLFNGMGGACAALISLIEAEHFLGHSDEGAAFGKVLVILAGLIIGSVSFSGSMIAFMKLNGTLNKPFRLPSYNIVNIIVLLGTLGLSTYLLFAGGGENISLIWIIFILSLLYGVMFVLPIGGADMPVVISLLNSFTGLAAAFGGFLYDNQVMLTGGILVGSAGTILTLIMCKAMNRSLSNVIFGAFGAGPASGENEETTGSIKEISVSDLAVLMNYSRNLIVVPGYGLAVAQAQHAIKELDDLLTSRGVEVKYAVHPVAGRMPGHMNVLLAESNVSYDKLFDMDEINGDFPSTDVVLVVGANDVVNPAARNNPQSPIFGMPILDADKAKNVIVNKRSMGKGYAGIENELFYFDNCRMVFGDAKQVITKIVSELKEM